MRCAGLFPSYTVKVCDMEQRSDGNFTTAIIETMGILAVGFFILIVRIEAAEPLKD